MSKFLTEGDVVHPKLVYTLPVEKRPEKLMYHGVHYPLEGDTLAVCVVHPNGEVKIFPLHSRLTDVMRVLHGEYDVPVEELGKVIAAWA